LAQGEIKRHEFQPPAFFASAGSTIAKLALAQDIQRLKGCTESYRRANLSRKERGKCGSLRSPLASFFFNMLF